MTRGQRVTQPSNEGTKLRRAQRAHSECEGGQSRRDRWSHIDQWRNPKLASYEHSAAGTREGARSAREANPSLRC
jgi:hypothetical protein